MKIDSIQLVNFRSFAKTEAIELGAVDVLIGANNSGKSSVLKALYLMQSGAGSGMPDVRVGNTHAEITLEVSDIQGNRSFAKTGDMKKARLVIRLDSVDRKNGGTGMTLTSPSGQQFNGSPLSHIAPEHFVVPYLAKRKTSGYGEDVRSQYALQILPTMTHLAAKLSRISNPSFPAFEEYSATCKEVLGFLVTAVPSENGQQPGVYLPSGETLTIDQMGEGVPNIVQLLADLSTSQGKLFLIEEPENDLHPRALKALLELISRSAKSNQFVISTHSNIVVRHLGSLEGARIYNVSAEFGKLPTEARISRIGDTVEARMEVLRDLGYSFSDFDLWDGWLILEESSAERILRDYLIPWFAPKLSRVRTLAVNGTGNVGATFDDFQRLVRFTHLERAYAGAAWVRVDGDESGQAVIAKLRSSYSEWPADRFDFFKKNSFELYYPAHFEEQVKQVLGLMDRKSRRSAKHQLLDQVRAWLDEDEERGKEALQMSAQEIIEDLRTIERQLVARQSKDR